MYLILAIDDDVNVHKLLDAQIKTFGYRLVSAYKSEDGVALASTGNPDLILLDILMPIHDGMETLKRLRADGLTREIPVIMLTSKSSVNDVANAMKAGAADYIRKPYEVAMLKKKIETAIHYSKMRKTTEIGEKSEHIKVNREAGRTVITFTTPLGNPKIIEDLKMIFSKGFLNITIKDRLVLDFRQLDEIEESSVPIVKAIFSLFPERHVYVIAGRHYGSIVSDIETSENIHLYISPGDMELEMENIERAQKPFG